MNNENIFYTELTTLWEKGVINPKEWGAYNYNFKVVMQIIRWLMERYMEDVTDVINNEEYENWRSEATAAGEAIERELEETAPMISKIIGIKKLDTMGYYPLTIIEVVRKTALVRGFPEAVERVLRDVHSTR